MNLPLTSHLASMTDGPRRAPGAIPILVVDDEPAMADATAFLLRAHGFDVAVASDPEEGRSLLSQRSFDVIITDLVMPGGGRHWLERLRADHPQAHVIVLTATAPTGSTRADVYRLADAVLLKPVHADALLSVLRDAVA